MTAQHHQLWIDGKAVEPNSGQYFADLNPLDDSVYAHIAKADATDVKRAVESAHLAFGGFRHSLPRERENWLLAAAELLQKQSDEFVDLLIDEVGSPVSKARREVASSVGILRAAAGITRRLTGKTLPTDVAGRLSISTRRPVGVIAGITPFNVPLIKGIKHSAMPLATGNTVVMLPSEAAPLMALRIARLYSEIGLPPGAVNVVTGHGHEIGDVLTSHENVRMVGFTGSTNTGRHIGELCGRLGKRFTLEMGGKNPLIVLQDADIDKAVTAAVVGGFLYQGQICMASSRIYVEQPVYEMFLQRFTNAAKHLSMGDLKDPATMIGPIINERQRSRIRQHVDNAIADGAVVETGRNWIDNRFQPTVLTNVSGNSVLNHEETFGPVVAVHSVINAEDALRRANDSSYGLSAAVYTKDLNQAMRFAEQLDAGMVHVNGATLQEEAHVPCGGIHDSGFGREGTDAAIEDMTEWKWITIDQG